MLDLGGLLEGVARGGGCWPAGGGGGGGRQLSICCRESFNYDTGPL